MSDDRASVRPWAIVVAGGSGARFGALKQLQILGGRRVLDWSVDAIAPVVAGVVVVVPQDRWSDLCVELADLPVDAIVPGGATRSDSVRAGLAALGPEATHVLVHDAARPLATPALAERVVDALAAGAAGVVPVVPVTDSLRTVEGEPVDRSRFVAVQTPQGFRLDDLREAHRSDQVATDDAALLDRLGLPVVHVDGETANLKITQPHDLRLAEALLAEVEHVG